MAEKRAKRLKLIVSILTLCALAGLIYALRVQIIDTIRNLDDINFWLLFLMIPAQAINYNAYTQLYRGLFKILDRKIAYKEMLRIVSELNFVNNVFPSGGVSGFSYFGLRMRRYDIRAGRATLVQAMRFILVFVGFQVLLSIGLVTLALGGQANNFLILIAGSMATLLFVGTLLAAYIVGSERRINNFFVWLTRIMNKIIHKVRPKHPETISVERVKKLFNELHQSYEILKKSPKALAGPLKNALLASVGEILTIYVVYMAFGVWVNPGAVIIAYAVANFAGLVSVLPGGVGIYEALMTAVLVSAGVDPAIALSVTITYRVLNMAIQLPPGGFFYYKTIHSNKIVES